MNKAFKNPSDRFLSIAGSINFRDFGGYINLDGRQVSTGKLFRCGNMAEILPDAFDDFANLKISAICDLRSHEEVETSPTPSGYPFESRVHLPIWPGSSVQFQKKFMESGEEPKEKDFREFMINVTREIALDHMDVYSKFLNLLLNASGGFLFHCSAGKDRTGIGGALILHALGVEKKFILEDYLLSNESIELLARTRARMQENQIGKNLPAEVLESIVHIFSGVEPIYLNNAFTEIEKVYGNLDNYLSELDFGENKIAMLREKLLI
tara:strand:+ start:2167 stop:2967 length:801 start_codon:yes stop_codon:yes gene_type:complete